MSPQAGEMLLNQIVPRLNSSLSHHSPQFRIDDAEELLQDAVVIAAQLLDAVERNGKTVTPGNIAWYAGRQIRSGRRSTGHHRNDVMHPAARMALVSLDAPIPAEDGDECLSLGDVLTTDAEDPSETGARNLDWAALISKLDQIGREILRAMAEEIPLREVAEIYGVSRSTVQDRRNRLTRTAREFLGADALAQSQQRPRWRDNVGAERERMACRMERRMT